MDITLILNFENTTNDSIKNNQLNQNHNHNHIKNQQIYKNLNEIREKFMETVESFYQKPINDLLFQKTSDNDLAQFLELESNFQIEFQKHLNEHINQQQQIETQQQHQHQQKSTTPTNNNNIKNKINNNSNKKRNINNNNNNNNIINKKQKLFTKTFDSNLNENDNDNETLKTVIMIIKRNLNAGITEFNFVDLLNTHHIVPDQLTSVVYLFDILECLKLVKRKLTTNNNNNNNGDTFIWNGPDSYEFKKLVFDIYHSRTNFMIDNKIEFSCQKCEDFYNLNLKVGRDHPHQHSETLLPKNTQLCAIACQFIKLILSSKLRTEEYLTNKQIFDNFFIDYWEDYSCSSIAANIYNKHRNSSTILKSINDITFICHAFNIIIIKREARQYQWNGNISILECKSYCPTNYYNNGK